MKLRTILELLIVLFVCSCSQRTSKGEHQIKIDPNQHVGSKNGLLFEHGGYRGTEYTDSQGTNFNLRYNPILITNDSTIPIHVQIAFAKEYDYPTGYDNKQFKVFPLPIEWAQDGTTDGMFDQMWKEFENVLEKPFLNATLEPSENLVFAIGTLYPLPPEVWWVVPNELFTNSNDEMFPTCDWFMNEDPLSNSEIALGLKLHLDERCTIIPCGQISYP